MRYMPFGKHRGKPITEVPGSYLEWMLRGCDLDENFEAAVREELESRISGRQRQSQQKTQGNTAQNGASPPAVARAIDQWYRSLCMAYHPDRGGSNEAIKAINDANERLRKILNL